ncbi:TolC family protein [Aquimarina agarilytica]|uniref:TolC family protein n=1 Tax=Aquimarina agarilytica TaxID=1087449 RepID=UPI000288F179|nr:TolC family protein [Aquimarina agarilytica]
MKQLIKNSTICGFVFFLIGIGELLGQQLVTPTKAVELALEHNYGIKLITNRLKVAETDATILNSGYLPSLTANAGATFNKDNINADFSNGSSTSLNGAESSRYNASLDLNYTLFDGLGRRYNYKLLQEQHKLTELQVRETIENTVEQLFAVYYNVAQLIQNVKANETLLNISRERLTRANYQFEYGQNTKLGVLNAKVDINNDTINLINTKQQLVNAKRDLNLILGNELKQNFEVASTIDFIAFPNKSELLDNIKAKNVALLQADQNIQINKYTINSNKAAYLPTVGLTGSYGWNQNDNNSASFVAVSTTTGLSARLNLRWNLFDGGGAITRVKTSKLNLENRELQKKQLELRIERDFNNAWDDYENKLLVYKVQEQNIVTAQNNFDRTKEKFKIGQVNSIEFRQAQLNLLNAELSRNQAKYQAKLAELRILRISGELLNTEF